MFMYYIYIYIYIYREREREIDRQPRDLLLDLLQSRLASQVGHGSERHRLERTIPFPRGRRGAIRRALQPVDPRRLRALKPP